MSADPAHEPTLSTNEVAARLGLHPSTVTRKRKRGELVAHEVSRGDGTFAWRYPVQLLPPAKPAQGERRPQPADHSADPSTATGNAELRNSESALAKIDADLAAEAKRDRELAAYMLRRVLELEAEVRALRGVRADPARVPWWRRWWERLRRG